MNIQLKEWKVKHLSFKIKENLKPKKSNNNSFNLALGHFFPEDNNKEFGIGFQIKIKDEEFNILTEIVFLFEIDKEIDDTFKESGFITINAPAIAFPYVRSYISNLTLQSGFSPIILPSVNFVKLAKEKLDKKNIGK